MDRPPSGPGRGDGSQLRFAIVGPLLASPPPKGGLQAEFRRLSERVWTDAEEGRQRTFSASTIERWYYAALRADDDTMRPLRRRLRKDAGGRRAASAELIEALAAQYRRWSWWSVDLHHKNLVALLAERPGIGPVPSVSTLRRIMKDRGLARRPKPRPGDPPRRVRRETLAYEHGHSNALWHADFHWASFSITTRKGEVVRPRLLAILDDHSRICAHAQWYLGETSEAFVHGLSQAFMKLGLPRSLMTDNGSPMIAGEVAQGLRDLGVTFAGIPPRTPEHNAKVERFWGTVEGQLLAMFHPNAPPGLADLNRATSAWLADHYANQTHRELGASPRERYLSSDDLGRECPAPERLRFLFRIIETRKVRRADGTFTHSGVRFQLPRHLRHLDKVLVRLARWDLAAVDIVTEREPRSSAAAVRPVDKRRNAEAPRALMPQPPPPRPGAPGAAPLMAQLLRRHEESGMPAAYLPFHDEEEEESAS